MVATAAFVCIVFARLSVLEMSLNGAFTLPFLDMKSAFSMALQAKDLGY